MRRSFLDILFKISQLFDLAPEKEFIVRTTVDYDKSLNEVAKEYEWNRAWDSRNRAMLTAFDLQREFIHAGLNQRYVFAGEGKRVVPIHFFRFNRHSTTDEVVAWFANNDYRSANPKELLFAGLTELHEKDKKSWEKFSDRMFYIVSLMAMEIKDEFVFESGWRSIAIRPSEYMLGKKYELVGGGQVRAKPKLLLKTISQVGGDMIWDKNYVVFAAVKISDVPPDNPNSVAVLYKQAEKLGYR